MSGPVSVDDALPESGSVKPEQATVEVGASRLAQVGSVPIRRALPRKERRTVGAWCFVDHMGPTTVTADRGVDIAPHPHIGLQTVTWLLSGEAVHRDSLGSEQIIRPGQLNLMTAGLGVSHSEEATGRYSGDLHGAQLWIAQPRATRDGDAAFEHHSDLPKVDLGGAVATVLVGKLISSESPARRDTDHLGLDLELYCASTIVPLRKDYEYGIVVFSGALTIEGQTVEPGRFAYLGFGRDECRLVTTEPTRALLIGGTPFAEPVLKWWNFVARRRDEITAAYRDWAGSADRFGRVASTLPRIETGPPPWVDPDG
jgi:redox-sensitive bicupin YhaK (pirin superfamily)